MPLGVFYQGGRARTISAVGPAWRRPPGSPWLGPLGDIRLATAIFPDAFGSGARRLARVTGQGVPDQFRLAPALNRGHLTKRQSRVVIQVHSGSDHICMV